MKGECCSMVVMMIKILMLVGIINGVFGQSNNQALKFNENGEFKILQISDAHYANGKETPCRDVSPTQIEQGCSDLNTTDYLRRFIQAENPDLVIFTGDMIHGDEAKDYKKSFDEIFAPVIEANIPWAAVLGNWDVDLRRGISRNTMMGYISTLKNTLSQLNPSNLEEDEQIYGWGNYNLEVAGVKGSAFQHKSVLNLYLLDSGDYYFGESQQYFGYDYIHPSQQAWFARTSKELQEEYLKEPVGQTKPAPGMVFFHIPIPEFMNITESQMVGVKQEEVICAGVNSGFFDTVVASRDVKAVFVGHGHINDYCGKLSGIQLCYDAGMGYHGYGKVGWPRRARVINVKLEKTEDGKWGPVESFETWKRLHDDHLTKIDLQVLWTSSTDDRSGTGFKPIMSE